MHYISIQIRSENDNEDLEIVTDVRGSRAIKKSDWRRISPTFTPWPMGRGDMASPISNIISACEGYNSVKHAGVVGSSGESGTLEEDFKEDLSVESERGRVEGNGLDGGVDVVRTGNGV
jgi:hypothetical protein